MATLTDLATAIRNSIPPSGTPIRGLVMQQLFDQVGLLLKRGVEELGLFGERLSTCNLFKEFDDAVTRRDVPELKRILRLIYLPDDSVDAVIKQVLGTSGAL